MLYLQVMMSICKYALIIQDQRRTGEATGQVALQIKQLGG